MGDSNWEILSSCRERCRIYCEIMSSPTVLNVFSSSGEPFVHCLQEKHLFETS